jgi:carboxylesterase type B
VTDGLFVPAQPALSLLHGNFDKSVKVMTGHNANEGILFTNPFIQNNSAFDVFLSTYLATAPASIISFIADTLYPAVFDGSFPYNSTTGRIALMLSEMAITCNTMYLQHAFGNNSYSYEFAVPPAFHGQDVSYTFWNGNQSQGLNVPVARALQKHIMNFVETGSPNGGGVPFFPMYGANSTIEKLGAMEIHAQMDDVRADVCMWWQLGLYV